MKKIITISLTIIMIFIFSCTTYAADFDPTDYEPPALTTDGGGAIIGIAQAIINALSVIGIIVAVITLITIGLKYMMGSVSEKADYKKTMIPYLIGVVMLVAITQVLRIIMNLVGTVE